MQIDPSVTETSLETKQKDLEVLNLQIQRLEALIQDKALTFSEASLESNEQLKLYTIQKDSLEEGILRYDMKLSQANSQYQSSISEKNRVLSILNKDLRRAKKLESVLDIIARKDYDELKKNIDNLQEQLNMARFKNK